MKLVTCTDKAGKKKIISFVRRIYKNDFRYVATSEFVLKDVLFSQTDFIRGCRVIPVAAVTEEGKIVAAAIYIRDKNQPYLCVGFFEAEENASEAANLILREAKRYAKETGAKGVAIGLNAHLSYGVGILTEGFEHKAPFDGVYNKSYYKDFFEGLRCETLSSYRGEKKELDNLLIKPAREITVRCADMNRFREETENLRVLCDRTIGKTFLYTPTRQGHFYQLLRDLKPFLKPQNLLFAERAGECVGFLFWHPDFNQMLKGGKALSSAEIALSYLFNRKNIDTMIVNAIGSLFPSATAALLNALSAAAGERYRYVETTFVWDNNRASSLLNRKLFGEPYRKYGVYFIDAID